MRRYAIVLVGFLGFGGCLMETEQPVVEGHDIRVTFIHTSDIHSRLLPYALDVGETDKSMGLDDESPTVGGAARATAIIKSIRGAGGRVVHIDTGDVFQGAPIFNLFKGEVEFKWLSMIGVDVFIIGNHEFDAGMTNFVTQAFQYATFPVLNANYGLEDPNVFGASQLGRIAKPYVIINAEGLKIGIIGLGSLSSIVSMYEGGNSLGITPLDTVQITQFYIDFLRPQVDVVMAASHLGLRGQKKMTRGTEDQVDDCEGPDCLEETSTACAVVHRLIGDEELIQNTEGLDLVLGGHLHIVINPPELVPECNPDPACAGQPFYEDLMRRGCMTSRVRRKVPLMHSGAFLKFVGQLDVIFHQPPPLEDETEAETWLRVMNGWEVKTYRADLHSVDQSVDRDRWDVATERLLEPFSAELYRAIQLTRFIAYSPRKIRRFSTGWGDSALGNLVANAMQLRNRVEAHFGLTNTLGIRADINRGPITEEMMYNVFPFENSITTITLSGREVQDLMDYVALRSARRGCQTQAQIAGMTTVFDCNEDVEASFRVTIGGSRLDDPGNYGRDADDKPYCLFDGLDCTPGADCDPTLETVRPCPAGQTIGDGVCCPLGELCTPLGCGTPISPYVSYKLAANDYIAAGGSGFTMLEHNTTQFNTGISMRDSVMDYVNLAFPGCGARTPDQLRFDVDDIYVDYFAAISVADFVAVSDRVAVYYEAQNNAGWANYGSCVEDLGETMTGDCNYLPDASVQRSQCRAETWLRAAEMCFDLPCVTMEEEGRIERIFPIQ